jgi:hypothetical protein
MHLAKPICFHLLSICFRREQNALKDENEGSITSQASFHYAVRTVVVACVVLVSRPLFVGIVLLWQKIDNGV